MPSRLDGSCRELDALACCCEGGPARKGTRLTELPVTGPPGEAVAVLFRAHGAAVPFPVPGCAEEATVALSFGIGAVDTPRVGLDVLDRDARTPVAACAYVDAVPVEGALRTLSG